MEGEALRDGKARVKIYLIDPLVKKGMQRKQGWTLEQEAELFESLQNYLAYLSQKDLEGLADTIERFAAGKAHDRWPKEINIRRWARRLREPPIRMSRLVRSYVQSGAGRAAKEGGYLVELFDYLKRVGAPPNTYSIQEIMSEAVANQERRNKVRSGRGTQQDQVWFERYMNRRRICADLLSGKFEEVAA